MEEEIIKIMERNAKAQESLFKMIELNNEAIKALNSKVNSVIKILTKTLKI